MRSVSPLAFLVGLLLASALPLAGRAEDSLARDVARLRALTPKARSAAPRVCERPARGSRPDPERLERAIRDASLRFGVDAHLIRSVIHVESNGDPGALSRAGAMGLMQLMPRTARGLGVVCAYDVRENVTGGTRYLRRLRDQLGNWPRALAGYHAGPSRVRRGRVPAVTDHYVERVIQGWRARR